LCRGGQTLTECNERGSGRRGVADTWPGWPKTCQVALRQDPPLPGSALVRQRLAVAEARQGLAVGDGADDLAAFATDEVDAPRDGVAEESQHHGAPAAVVVLGTHHGMPNVVTTAASHCCLLRAGYFLLTCRPRKSRIRPAMTSPCVSRAK